MNARTKSYILVFLGMTGFMNGFLLFASMSPHIMWWYNPFLGMLYVAILPFAGAITMLFPDKKAQA